MPREGVAQHIDDVWRARVTERLTEKGWKRSTLAEAAGCPRSLITELLNGTRSQTTFLREIHEALELPPPMPPLPTKDTGELMYLWDHFDDVTKARLLERARVMFESIPKKPK